MFGRRELFFRGGAFALLSSLPSKAAEVAGGIYRKIGVRPIINARGTFTIVTGSQSLPQVKKAMDEASRSFVHMDELMEGVSKRLAELTGADWGIVTNGCCAAIAHTTAACIAGSNPERMQRLPNLAGLKNEVIIPTYSRNVYDHAVRMLGTQIVEVSDPAKLEGAFNSRTAMVYILAGPGDEGPLGTAVLAAAAKRHGVPVLVDAAAEILTVPNVHLQRGATAVAYSGGKCIRGPQAAGLLLGEKNLLQAAWLNSAPHHAYGRSMKVGKEEIMGMLAAVEAWKTRDHDAEWKQWESNLQVINSRVSTIAGVTTKVLQPDSLSNRTPSLRISFDGSGAEVAKGLLDGEPRIVLTPGSNSITVTPYMLMPGEEKIVADQIYAAISKAPKAVKPEAPRGGGPSVDGAWILQIDFQRGSIGHKLAIQQDGGKLTGTHSGEFVSGALNGTINSSEVAFRSSQKMEGTQLGWDFKGTATKDRMSGTVKMGEYGEARWTAVRA